MSLSLQAGVRRAKTPLEVLGGQGLLPEPGAAVKSSDRGLRVMAPCDLRPVLCPVCVCVCVSLAVAAALYCETKGRLGRTEALLVTIMNERIKKTPIVDDLNNKGSADQWC